MRKTDPGWHRTSSGNWYNVNVSRGLSAYVEAICVQCGNDCLVRKYRNKDAGKPIFCSQSCLSRHTASHQDLSHLKKYEFKKGQPAHNYKGRTRHAAGYNVFCEPKGKRQLEHRLIVEQFLGRKLRRNEIIHHINGVKTDNRIENLRLMTQSEHLKLHQEEEKVKDETKYRTHKSHAARVRWGGGD